MSSFINAGAYVSDARPASKTALKAALETAPDTVWFDGTSTLGPQFSGPAGDIPEGVTLSVVGPDPYRRRTWYATVERTGDKFRVK